MVQPKFQRGPWETAPVLREDRSETGGTSALSLSFKALRGKAAENKSAAADSGSAPINSRSGPGLPSDDALSMREGGPALVEPPGYAYHRDGRRDPFMSIIVVSSNKAAEVNLNVPPLQRISLSELNVIGIIWGEFGYVAMVQTPDGRGYTVREGTRVGTNNGVVSSIAEEAFTVQEPYADLYGKTQMREHLILLHPKPNGE
jgi:type IV pilus assembly protein PilP